MAELFPWLVTAMLLVFVGVGLVLLTRSLQAARAFHRRVPEPGSEHVTLSERGRRYVGPVRPDMALLNTPLRVAVEAVTALCGFPGLGWLISGRVVTGVVLLAVVPSLVWGIIPMVLSVTGDIYRGPFVAVGYLPVLAVVSALGLTMAEIRRIRREHAEVAR